MHLSGHGGLIWLQADLFKLSAAGVVRLLGMAGSVSPVQGELTSALSGS